MMISTRSIKRVCLGELRQFIGEHRFPKGSVWPLTPQRVDSYCSNPNGSAHDVVLIYVEEEKEIVAFRTIWADRVWVNGEPLKFGWCSGNWVSPAHRRKGLSSILLKEVYNDWEGRLMFTNYAPESLNGYLKSGLFPFKIERIGKRFYFNTPFYQLLRQRSANPLWRFFSLILAVPLKVLIYFKMIFYRPRSFRGVSIVESDDCQADFFKPDISLTKPLLCRGKKEYEWIFTYPWITGQLENKVNYPFSQHDGDFSYRFVTFEKNGNPIGRLIVSNRGGMVKMPYASAKNPEGYHLIAQYMADYCYQNKISSLTIIDQVWARLISGVRSPFLFSKSFEMNIYSTFNILPADDLVIYDGDGDYIFT